MRGSLEGSRGDRTCIQQDTLTGVVVHQRYGLNSTDLAPTALSVTPLGSWKSPRTGRTYSSGWKVNVPGGSLTMTPEQLNQESSLNLPPVDYWEGSTTVTGTIDNQAVTGKGYTEITPPQCLCGF